MGWLLASPSVAGLDVRAIIHGWDEPMKSPEMRAKTAALGEKIRQEAGVEVAVRLIEGCNS